MTYLIKIINCLILILVCSTSSSKGQKIEIEHLSLNKNITKRNDSFSTLKLVFYYNKKPDTVFYRLNYDLKNLISKCPIDSHKIEKVSFYLKLIILDSNHFDKKIRYLYKPKNVAAEFILKDTCSFWFKNNDVAKNKNNCKKIEEKVIKCYNSIKKEVMKSKIEMKLRKNGFMIKIPPHSGNYVRPWVDKYIDFFKVFIDIYGKSY